MSPDMPTLTLEDRDGVPTVTMAGEFDLAVADDLRAALSGLSNEESSTPTVDLAAVTFLDSSCLGVLLEFQQRTQDSGGKVVLLAPSAPCRRVLEITGVDALFEIRS